LKYEATFPALVARFIPNDENFSLFLRDRSTAGSKQSLHWVVRWWAIPALGFKGEKDVQPDDLLNGLPDELLADRIRDQLRNAGATGLRIADLARDLGITTDSLNAALRRPDVARVVSVRGGRVGPA
jgi:hypothetical protein